MKKLLLDLLFSLSERTGFASDHLLSKYKFMHQPIDILKLLELYKSTANTPGSYIEVGCAYGATTVLLKKFDNDLSIGRRFVAIDTFSGFVEEHARHDIDVLGKDASLRQAFRLNSKAWMLRTLRHHALTEVEVVQGDATGIDYAAYAPIAFCLLDIDLYRPIKDLLPRILERLAPGGLIVVDDCRPHPKWEGALIAYNEFMDALGKAPEIAASKYGLVRKEA